MAKVRGPLHSFRASGTACKYVVFRDYVKGYNQQTVVNVKGFKKKPTGEGQRMKQEAIKACQKVWAELSADEKMVWEFAILESDVSSNGELYEPDLPGYHKFMSVAVKAYLAGDEIPRAPAGGLII